MPAAAAVAGAAVLGGVAGAQKDKVTQSGSTAMEQRVIVDPAGEDEKKARQLSLDALTSLDARLKSLESSPVLSNLDKLMQEMGGAPTAERINQANSLADSVYAPQQTALNQSFQDQTQAFANRAAQMGRSSSDPILAAKLAQEQVRQQAMLSAQKGSFATQEAINGPARQFQNQLGALGGLSQQAIQNRQAVFSLGSDFANTQMQYRLATATRTGNSVSNNEQLSGGGFKGFVTGLMGAGGSAASAAPALAALSDRAMKEDIEELFALPVYEYKYKQEAGRYRSPMAQDLETAKLGKPAVFESEGKKHVDYGRLTGAMFAQIKLLTDRVKQLEEAANVR
jgi:hypothetical protein